MRRELATRHVHRTEFGWQLTSDQRLAGRIEWDPNSDVRLPLIIIDGKPFTWEQVGHMLMTFEGFTLEALTGRSPNTLRQCASEEVTAGSAFVESPGQVHSVTNTGYDLAVIWWASIFPKSDGIVRFSSEFRAGGVYPVNAPNCN